MYYYVFLCIYMDVFLCLYMDYYVFLCIYMDVFLCYIRLSILSPEPHSLTYWLAMSYHINPPILLFYFTIELAILGLLPLYIKFRI